MGVLLIFSANLSIMSETMTVSIGAYHFQFFSETPDEIPTLLDDIIAKSDIALYQAKNQGRNRLVSYKK